MKVLYALLLVIAATSAMSIEGNENQVKMTVNIEPMCNDSTRFFTKQLFPTFQALGQYMDVTLRPFGKDNFTANGDGWNFTCQHGDAACKGNLMLACILNQVSAPEEYIPLINCIMDGMLDSDDPPTAAKQCFTNYGNSTTDYETVDKCAKSVEGQNLLHDIGVETKALQPALTYVPWIIFNDEFIEADWKEAEKDLKGFLCKKYLSGKPECRSQIILDLNFSLHFSLKNIGK